MTNNLPMLNDFSDNVPSTINYAASIESSRSNKEVEAAVLLAKKFPRNEQSAANRIANSCSRPKFASSAIYSFKRGGQKVEGASIRLAEVIARNWGNLQFGVKEVDRRENMSIVEAFCWDLETNTRSTKEFAVLHVRDTKEGQKQLTNERDIYEMIANQGARRLRNCILSCVPDDLVELAKDKVNETLSLAAKGSAVDMQAKIRSMLEAFNGIGVSREMLEKYLNVKPEAASAKQIVDLGKIYNSLKEGYSEIKDWFKVSEASIQQAIIREDLANSLAFAVEKLEATHVHATDLGIDPEALKKINPDLTNLDQVLKAQDMLDTMIADALVERGNK